MQTWCRGKKQWESETLCCDCHAFSWRSYSCVAHPARVLLRLAHALTWLVPAAHGRDPDFLLPEEYEKRRWDALVADTVADKAAKQAVMAHTIKAA